MEYISIEGNIGNGKSTLLKKLSEDPEFSHYFIPLYEPVDEWIEMKDEEGKNLLQKYYEDKNRWSYTMQTFAFLTKMKNIKNAMQNILDNNLPKRIIAERSLLTDFHIFAKSCHDNGNMNMLEWNIYQSWFTHSYREYTRKYLINTRPKFIYLRLEPYTSLERIHKRNRTEEKGIPFDYLQNLHTLHEEWLLNPEMENDVCVIDASTNFELNEEEYQRIKEMIRNFLSLNE
jgi:deoxycitidine kinase